MTSQDHVIPSADRDPDAQAGYLMQEAGLETALRFHDAAATTFKKLARMPAMGERHQSNNPQLDGVRVWRIEGFPNHLIFYRPLDSGIEVVRVLHAARDIDRALESDPIN